MWSYIAQGLGHREERPCLGVIPFQDEISRRCNQDIGFSVLVVVTPPDTDTHTRTRTYIHVCVCCVVLEDNSVSIREKHYVLLQTQTDDIHLMNTYLVTSVTTLDSVCQVNEANDVSLPILSLPKLHRKKALQQQ